MEQEKNKSKFKFMENYITNDSWKLSKTIEDVKRYQH